MSTYRAQQILNIGFEFQEDISEYASFKILFTDPSGVKGEWIATRDGKIISHEFTGADELKQGTYKLQPVAYSAGGRALPGDPVTLTVAPSLL